MCIEIYMRFDMKGKIFMKFVSQIVVILLGNSKEYVWIMVIMLFAKSKAIMLVHTLATITSYFRILFNLKQYCLPFNLV